MRKVLLIVLLAVSLEAVTGCKSFYGDLLAASLKKGKARLNFTTYQKFHICPRCIKKKSFEGSTSIADVNVVYQRGLEQQADCIAKHFSELLDEVEQKTAFQISCRTKFYLFRVDKIPQTVDVTLQADVNELQFPLFVEAGNESCQAIFSQNIAYPKSLVHELTEFSLILPKQGGIVLPDAKGRLLLFPINILKYTRWFRDGFAEYVGYLAYQIASKEEDFAQSRDRGYSGLRKYPFSSLRKVGNKLFSWHQYSSDKSSDAYYDAALGLFLLIEQRFGEDAIKKIMLEVNKQEYLDGSDLIKIFNGTLNTDIVQLAEDFKFPKTGLKTEPLMLALVLNEGLDVKQGLFVKTTDPNSPAETAGIKKKDVILKVNDRPIRNHLDFELAIFKVMDDQSAELAIWRKDKGEFVLKLPLTNGR